MVVGPVVLPRLADDDAPIAEIVADPVARVGELASKPNPRIPAPRDIFRPERAAAEGRWDGAFSAVLDELDEVFSRSALALPQMLGLVPELRWTDIVDPDVEALLTVPKRPGLVF